MIRVIAVVALFYGTLAAGSNAPKSDVSVLIGKVIIPLSVMHHFPAVAGALPQAGEMPVEDPHEKQHDSHTFCYRFADELIEFFDSDLGLFKVSASRLSKNSKNSCPALKERPMFEVAGKRFSLRSKDLPALDGFHKEAKEGVVTIKRAWQERPDKRTCFDNEISVEAIPAKSGWDRITVMSWSEPGC